MEFPRYRFTAEQYLQLAEVGILDWDERTELLEGNINAMHPTTRRLFTVKDCNRMVELGIIPPDHRVELLEGELIEMPSSNESRERSVKSVADFFAEVLKDDGTLTTQVPITFHERTQVCPDIVLFSKWRDWGFINPAPQGVCLVVELAEAARLNYICRLKIPFYARAAIVEVWVVDLARNYLEVRTFANPARGTYKWIERGLRGGLPRYLHMFSVQVKVADVLSAARAVDAP